jgi:hypothetical protein
MLLLSLEVLTLKNPKTDKSPKNLEDPTFLQIFKPGFSQFLPGKTTDKK